MSEKLGFASDYMEGAHPAIMQKLLETNLNKSAGYGFDEYSESAREKIRKACDEPEADVYFLVGGTQANKTVIDAMLQSYQGVIAADNGHINVHEAGAIENGGHKVMAVPGVNGKVKACDVEKLINDYNNDESCEHMVMPGMVYISHPSEYGTLYSLEELEALSSVCRRNNIPLYLDGARLAYGLACPESDVTLKDIARLCDAFYIGGTKCGALFGEAVVFPKKNTVPHFFSIIKQHGALLAKGRIAGIQFDTMFNDNLYHAIGENGIKTAVKIRRALEENGYNLHFGSPTNQIFVELSNDQKDMLDKAVDMSFWERLSDDRVIVRIATSWATTDEDVDKLINVLISAKK
ncbi:MAG: aminotransferase class I/II-fold pyridoxal phosphate-dependent enzyme [Lachnospiraceae bacterium]|nr:aminotransferase class I/II-fold pyridoxal phosphate-dependent enzyme [Lachnospiraceae bacterium]